MKRLIVAIILCVLLCAGSVWAMSYGSEVYGQEVVLEVLEIIPGILGVMVVTVDGEWLCNIGWHADDPSGLYYGNGGVVFAVDGNVLTLFRPVFWVFYEKAQ